MRFHFIDHKIQCDNCSTQMVKLRYTTQIHRYMHLYIYIYIDTRKYASSRIIWSLNFTIHLHHHHLLSHTLSFYFCFCQTHSLTRTHMYTRNIVSFAIYFIVVVVFHLLPVMGIELKFYSIQRWCSV